MKRYVLVFVLFSGCMSEISDCNTVRGSAVFNWTERGIWIALQVAVGG